MRYNSYALVIHTNSSKFELGHNVITKSILEGFVWNHHNSAKFILLSKCKNIPIFRQVGHFDLVLSE